ncbi:YdcF family protein [Dongia deserti]|uniref:YdcF family protein n=1 Tax=Dongia deserti TaxID=2268030 RepID=UPI000E6515A7|nr:YdcF family protein [Dongia deserti]
MRAGRITFKEQPPSLGRRISHGVLLLIVIWLGGFLAFAAAIPPRVPDPDRPVDAIVVLTGGDVRLAEGFALLDRGLAKKLLISGVSSGVDMPALLQTLNGAAQPQQAVLDCCVTLGYDARSTEGNARESLRWLTENEFTTVRLVTANYHMNRSLIEFRRVMPGITIIPNPVFPRQMQDPYWFVRPNTIFLLFNEYHKYLAAAVRAKVSDVGNAIAGVGTRIAAMVGL